jgi:hypothetical protein
VCKAHHDTNDSQGTNLEEGTKDTNDAVN